MINDDLRWTQRGWFGNLQPSAAKTTKRCRAESTHCASGCKMTHPAGVKKPSVKHGSCEYHLAEIQSVTNLKLAAIMRPLGWFTYIYIYMYVHNDSSHVMRSHYNCSSNIMEYHWVMICFFSRCGFNFPCHEMSWASWPGTTHGNARLCVRPTQAMLHGLWKAGQAPTFPRRSC